MCVCQTCHLCQIVECNALDKVATSVNKLHRVSKWKCSGKLSLSISRTSHPLLFIACILYDWNWIFFVWPVPLLSGYFEDRGSSVISFLFSLFVDYVSNEFRRSLYVGHQLGNAARKRTRQVREGWRLYQLMTLDCEEVAASPQHKFSKRSYSFHLRRGKIQMLSLPTKSIILFRTF